MEICFVITVYIVLIIYFKAVNDVIGYSLTSFFDLIEM